MRLGHEFQVLIHMHLVVSMQGELVAALLAAGEAELAEQLHRQSGVPGPLPAAEPGVRAARAAADAAKYLQMSLPPEAVHGPLPQTVTCLCGEREAAP